jgi:long-chain fatty acid transport protein
VDTKASVKLPDTFILSATQKLGDQWELLGDISWTGWSSIPKIDVLTASGTLIQRLDTEFRDTWRVAAGANYQLNDAWKVKLGLAYDQTPVKGATTRLVSLPDNDRVWFSLGAQWKPAKTTTIDVGASYLLVKDGEINNNQSGSAPSRGTVTGTYDNSAIILGAQLSMAF